MNDTKNEEGSELNAEEVKKLTIEDLKKLSESRRMELRKVNGEIENININLKLLPTLVTQSKALVGEVDRIGKAVKNIENVYVQRGRVIAELNVIHRRLVEVSQKSEDVILTEETRKLLDRTQKMIQHI